MIMQCLCAKAGTLHYGQNQQIDDQIEHNLGTQTKQQKYSHFLFQDDL